MIGTGNIFTSVLRLTFFIVIGFFTWAHAPGRNSVIKTEAVVQFDAKKIETVYRMKYDVIYFEADPGQKIQREKGLYMKIR